jgi:hypothetical protein
MARRQQHGAKKGAGKPRGVRAQIPTRPRDGRMVGEEDKQDDTLERIFARFKPNPRYAELLRSKITLKESGIEIPLNEANALLARLRDMQERKPDQFATLVVLVKPKRAVTTIDEVPSKALAILKKHGVVMPNGAPEKRIAAILNAAYIETKEGVIIRDPVVYPSQEFADELKRLDHDFEHRLDRTAVDVIREDRRKGPDKDDGKSR